MTKQDLKKKQDEYRLMYGSEIEHWQGKIITKWEKKLLFDLSAIDETGVVCDYPMLEIIEKDKGTKVVDYSGNIQTIKNASTEISREQNKVAKLSYYPKAYSEYIELDAEIKNDAYAVEQAKRQQQLLQDKQAEIV